MSMSISSPLLKSAYAGKKVFVTGHTGFKGSWLCEWLLQLGAKVTGYSLPPPTRPALFQQLELKSRLNHIAGDICDLSKLQQVIRRARPDYVFHLAAQPLVRDSYVLPVATFQANLIGTVNLLEALRGLNKPCAAVFITTDKCYENREWLNAYREEDALGGYDPYSASKAAAELAIGSYRRSFFKNHPVKIASARAGNVIGGGDWAADRIVPDCIRALQKQQVIPVRNKIATRPWQHVLEPLSGYLWLATRLAAAPPADEKFASAFNFGPNLEANRTVRDLVLEVLKHWPGKWVDKSNPRAVHEAGRLNLATDKAFHLLGWQPVWGFPEAVSQTVGWYRSAAAIKQLTQQQIDTYGQAARARGILWAQS